MLFNSKTKKIIKVFTAIILTVFLFTPFTKVSASENQFRISVSVTGSVALPTAPTNLSATVISESQINLSWDAGTAGSGVSFYRIYRDSVLIGSTANLNFSDTDLSPNTLYEYRISTVDTLMNESPLSDSVLATTFRPVMGGGGNNGGSSLAFMNINISTQPNSVVINWITNRVTIGKIFWGKTKDYESGSLQSNLYTLAHQAKINELESGTLYYVMIQAKDSYGREIVSETQFETKELPDFTPPANPTNFVAIPNYSSINLSWNNPKDKDFKEVRIIRSDIFYPKDVLDGEEIYVGDGESFEDKNLEVGKIYFYTIFAVDKEGNYSSGSITHSRVPFSGEELKINPSIYDFLPKSPIIDPAIEKLTLLDFQFIQEKEVLTFIDGTVPLDGSKPFTVFLSYEKVPEILKTISITLYDPEDESKVFSFLLRINKEKTGYEATIAPLGKSGNYKMHISILDYKNQGLKKIDGNLLASVFSADDYILSEEFKKIISKISDYFSLILFLIVVIGISRKIWFLVTKKKEDDTNTEGKVKKLES